MADNDWIARLARYGQNNPLTEAGDYWSADNARFEATNPGTMARIGRAVNPLTAFGSAMGTMHDAASEGDKLAMALAAIGAVPAFGKLTVAQRPIEGLIGEVAAAPSLRKTAVNVAGNTASQLGLDQLAELLRKGSK
jgi:hypothetical protein